MVSLVAVVLLAVLIAYLSVRRRNVLSGTVDVLSMVPYIIPGTVVGIALVTSFNQKPLAFTGTMVHHGGGPGDPASAVHHPFLGGHPAPDPHHH